METFNYVVMSKGIILLAGDETMQNSIRTFAVPLSAEMAPAATIVVYQVGRYGDVVADSLTFPVNGISRNNVSRYSSVSCEKQEYFSFPSQLCMIIFSVHCVY